MRANAQRRVAPHLAASKKDAEAHMARRFVAALAAALAGLTGCDAGGSAPEPLAPPAALLYVTPKAAEVVAGRGTASFTALRRNVSGSVSWTIDPAGTGTLSAASGDTVVFTPPASVAETSTVRLTARAGGRFDVVTVVVRPFQATLAVTPGAVETIAGGAPTTFAAILRGAADPTTWSLDPPDAGTLSAPAGAIVEYTPPTVLVEPVAVTLTARAAGLSAAAVITVVPGSLVVMPAALDVVAGRGPRTFTARAAAGTVSWSLDPPEGGSLSAASGETVEYTPPASVAARTMVTLTASAAGLTRPASISVWPSTPGLTVTGRVVTEFGAAAPGQRVVIGSASALTDETGSFTIADVSVPYDASVFLDGSSSVIHHVWLTRPDPTFTVEEMGPTATLHVTVEGGLPAPTGCARSLTVLFCTPPRCVDSGYSSLPVFPLAVPAGSTGSLHVFESFWDAMEEGYLCGLGAVAHVPGLTPLAGDPIDLAPMLSSTAVPQGSLTPQVSAPAGYRAGARLSYDCGGAEWTLPWWGTGTAPLLAGCSLDVVGEAQRVVLVRVGADYLPVVRWMREFRRGLTVGDSPAFALSEGIRVSFPEPGAFVSGSTEFSWVPSAGGVHELRVFPEQQKYGGYVGPTYRVYTPTASARLPDLTAHGLALPQAGLGFWAVTSSTPVVSPDGWAAPARPRPTGDWSASQPFRLAP